MDNEDSKRKGSPTGCSGRFAYGLRSQSLRRVSDQIYVSVDFTVMAFFTGRLWLLKVQGVTIGRFKTIHEIMDFIDIWGLGE